MKLKKIISLLLLVFILASLVGLAGCSKNQETSNSLDENQKISIKYWVPFTPNQYIKSLNESEMYKELEKRTNVHVEFIHPAEGQEKEQFNLMITSDELPDVIQSYAAEYKGGIDKAIEDGVYLRLNELIDKYAPNYKKLLEEDPELARQVTTDKGNIYCFALIGEDKNEPAWWGPVIRKDWLDELGLKEPETIDEWENVLRQFKIKKKIDAPLVINKKGIDGYGVFVSAFDVGPGFYRRGDKVHYGPIEEGFKEYLKLMNKWYKEGLIDKDFATRDRKSREALITSGKTGAFITEYGLVDQYIASIKSTDPKAKFAPVIYPSLRKGEKVHYRVVNFRNGGYEAVITSACKNPEKVVKWFDYAYSKEGYLLFNYGLEGKTYVIENGKPKFTDFMLKNPDGDYWTICNKWKLDVGPYLRDYKAIPEFTKFDIEAMNQWTKAEADYVLPPLTLTAEEEEIYSNKMNDINTYKDEMVLKFITGKEPIEKFDEYVEQIKKMGIDEMIRIYQNALERYNNRQIISK